MEKSQSDLVMEYFMKHPKEDLSHGPIVDWVTHEWRKSHDEPPRDVWRAIRKLHQKGKLIKVKKEVYKFDPDFTREVHLFDFDESTKKKILEKDGFKCVVCGRGKESGVELVVDHIKPKDKGGTNDLGNGQTLCTEHNLLKRNYSQTETGKKFFIKVYEKAVETNDEKMIQFCKAIFDVYDEFKINGHVKRPNGNH
jgi:5-methylcytosine-specific restriction endonuclease McrA